MVGRGGRGKGLKKEDPEGKSQNKRSTHIIEFKKQKKKEGKRKM